MDDNFQIYPQLYLLQDGPIRADISTFEFISLMSISVLFLTLLTLVFQKILDEEIRLLEKQFEDYSKSFTANKTSYKGNKKLDNIVEAERHIC